MTEYFIPTRAAETEFVEKRSRFIGHLQPVETEAEARAFLDEMRRRYHDARHNCWCYLIREGGVVRYSDDGEPQGTAGQPMLSVFEKEGVTNLVCVVTRYFGGILLGAGGLARAYTRSAKDSLDAAGISVVRRWVRMLVGCSYKQFERVRQETERFGAVVQDTEYGAEILLTVLVPEADTINYVNYIRDLSAGEVEPLEDGEVFAPVALR